MQGIGAEAGNPLKRVSSINEVPNLPAVYAMYGGRGRKSYVAYVGITESLRQRLSQHLIGRDSSIATNTTAVGLNPDYVTEVRWWEHSDFSSKDVLEAAELLAFDMLEPALRSRGNVTARAKQLYNNEKWRERMGALFASEPSGILLIPSLEEALKRIADLERRVAVLENNKREEP